ncbi:MAG: ATP-binding protein [Bacteroidales bacterium]|nr:ATP-binding protein [Bacteroidales bacterium]
MNNTTNDIVPLWLKIKPEYIDENFEGVLEYLQNGNKSDSFYQATLDLLEERVEEHMESLEKRPAYYSESNSCDKSKLILEARLLIVFLMMEKEHNGISRKRLFLALLNTLSMLTDSELYEDILSLMVDNVINDTEPVLTFKWDDLTDFNPTILIHKILNGNVFPNPKCPETCFESKGCAIVKDNAVSIVASNNDTFNIKKTQLVSSMDILDGKMNVLTAKREKLKQSEEDNLEAMEKFTRNFILEQEKVTASRPKIIIDSYSNGDTLLAEVTTCKFGKITVRSIDPEYEAIEGTIEFNEAIYPLYYPDDFSMYLHVGQIIDVTVEDISRPTFSLRDGFVAHVIEDIVVGDDHKSKDILAKVTRVGSDKRGIKLLDWMTAEGYPVHTPYDRRFGLDDFGYIRITVISSGKYYGYLQGEAVEPADEHFDIQEAKRNVIESFDFEHDERNVARKPVLNSGMVKEILSLMIRYQKSIIQPAERFRVLCYCKIMAALIQSEELLDYISFIMSYFKQLLRFAKSDGGRIEELEVVPSLEGIDVVRQRCNIVKILKAYGDESMNGVLESIISEGDNDTQTKLARLVLSCNSISSLIPASTQNIIKREITRNLSLDTEDETNLEEENGIYLGMEDLHQEFKTSFVYPPENDMLPNYFVQEKNIFKSLCGFLNTEEGGTLYLGVTDLGYVCGFENDMKYLKHYQLDSYIRFIQDEAGRFYGNDVLNQFEMKPMYDGKVLAIKVKPYEDGVVEFGGKAYIRINNETRAMNDRLKQQIRRKRLEAKEKR